VRHPRARDARTHYRDFCFFTFTTFTQPMILGEKSPEKVPQKDMSP